MYFPFFNGSSSAAWKADIPFRKRPCAMYKDNAVENVVAETGRDSQWHNGITERSFNAVSALCVAVERPGKKLTWTICKAIGGCL